MITIHNKKQLSPIHLYLDFKHSRGSTFCMVSCGQDFYIAAYMLLSPTQLKKYKTDSCTHDCSESCGCHFPTGVVK